MTKKYNILFFFTDDQRFDTINALGNCEVCTPNIDELVKNGTSFTKAHIPGGTVGAVCMPSRAMLHTGRTLFHLEKDGSTIPENHTLLGETFQKAGYRTFGTGKWHNGTKAYARSFTDGGEIFFGGMHDHWNVPAYHYDSTGKYDNKSKQVNNPFFSNKESINTCNHIIPGKHSSELFCDVASKWIKEYKDDKPFYMFISFMAPHDPRSMPEEFLNMYDPEKISLLDNYIEEHPFDYGVSSIRDELLAPYPRTEKEVKKHIAEYYGMISHLDNELGKVIATLKESGKYEDTIIIFAADNGLGLGQHGLMGKQSAYEHSVRVPLVFAGPKIPQNEKRDAYVYLLDIYPTLCDLLGMEKPDSVEGVSFMNCFKDDNYKTRETLYFAYADLLRAVKDDHYKLIEYRGNNTHITQLFDLKNDPIEIHNLYQKEGYEEITERLKVDMLKYKDDLDDEKHPKGKAFWDAIKIQNSF
jgi:arylsulfatase A-like enzyme